MKVTIDYEITYDIFSCVIVDSLEGGSNYWYILNTDAFIDDLPKTKEPLSVRIAEALYNNTGVNITVYDLETDENLGQLNYDSCMRAFNLMSLNYKQSLLDIINEESDSSDADIFLQLAVMGEVVFG